MALALGCADEPAPTPIVLLSIDTLRADRLSCYGYERPTSPSLDRFAAESVRFEDASAQASATLPSHLSLFTSLNPPQLGITRPDGRNDTQARTQLRLADGVVTLAETLRSGGYHTAAFTDGVLVSERYGLDRGFDRFEVVRSGPRVYLDNFRETVARFDRFLEGQGGTGGAPLFIFLHTYDVHEPYSARPPFATAFTPVDYLGFRRLRGMPPRPQFLNRRLDALSERDVEIVSGLYDNGIRAVDASFGRLVEMLRRRRLYERALIVVLSDHGEEFMEHGAFGHGPNIHRELLHVPLLVRLPGGAHAGKIVRRPVALLDVAPTLLDYAGIAAPEQLEGRSLRGVIEGTETGAWLSDRPLFADVPDRSAYVRGLRRGAWKLIQRPGDGTQELYQVERDPGETGDVSGANRDIARRMGDELEAWVASMEEAARRRGTLAVPSHAASDRDHEEALRALGYLD